MRRGRIHRPAGRLALMVSVVLLAFGVIGPAMASGAMTDRIDGPFVTVVPTANADNPIGVELMFVECSFVQRVELPDGSAKETQACELTGPFVEFPGTPPEKAFRNVAGECIWWSDYWAQVDGSIVFASSISLTVTPSGQVHATSTYPADPLTPEVCGL